MPSFLLILPFLLIACTKKTPGNEPPLAEQGRATYNTHCTACHNGNPRLDGALGPATYGSSLELLERRIVHADYPAGYTPKRATKVMVALPFIKDRIPALHAYLNAP